MTATAPNAVPSPESPSSEVVELAPSYRIPVVLAIAGVPLVWLNLWLGLGLIAFGLFLGYQAATLRLRFTTTALDLYRSDAQFRSFPYSEWLNWRLFWSPVPILLYFKEVKSIHFVPILFDPRTLQTCLETHCRRV